MCSVCVMNDCEGHGEGEAWSGDVNEREMIRKSGASFHKSMMPHKINEKTMHAQNDPIKWLYDAHREKTFGLLLRVCLEQRQVRVAARQVRGNEIKV